MFISENSLFFHPKLYFTCALYECISLFHNHSSFVQDYKRPPMYVPPIVVNKSLCLDHVYVNKNMAFITK